MSDAFSSCFYLGICQNEMALSLVFKDKRGGLKNLEKREEIFDLKKNHKGKDVTLHLSRVQASLEHKEYRNKNSF